MLTNEQREAVAPRIMTLKIIAGALMLGVLMFSGVVSLMTDWQEVHIQPDIITLLGLGVGASSILMQFVIPKVLGNQFANLDSNPKHDPHPPLPKELSGPYSRLQVLTIVRLAILEGGAFLNLIFFVIDPCLISLVMVLAILIVMVLIFPRAEHIYNWLSDELRFGADKDAT